MELFVKKRNGKTELFDAEKINKVLDWACENIEGVNPSDVAMNAGLSITNKVKTKDIHEILIQSAANLISEESPNYQYVAARLRLFALRKEVWGGSEPPRLLDHLKKNKKIYDDTILESYSESEIHKIDKFVNHDRDYKFTHAGIQQVVEKYLICDRSSGKIYETPQFAFVLIPMVLYANRENRMELIREAYNHISKFKINLPTPVLCGVRSRTKFYSSCVLIDCGDSLESIFTTAAVAGKYTARRSGIGINMGRIRAEGSSIRNSEVISTGIIPFLKVMESTVKSTSQNGVRGGGATITVPWWHYEIEDVIVLKNNRGTDDNRVKKLDYCIQLDKFFLDKVKNDEEVTLFCPNESGLYKKWENYKNENFAEHYTDAEQAPLRLKKRIKARDLLLLLAKERLETGRIYVMFMDNSNNGCWTNSITITNLCCEIIQPVIPLSSETGDGEIGICILSAVNLLETKREEIPHVCSTIVSLLNALIDYQLYPFPAAERFCKNKRSLGVGVTNFAALLASKGMNHESPEAVEFASDLMEEIQYSLLSASCEEAEEFGPAPDFSSSSYHNGWLPTENQPHPDVTFEPKLDWDMLRDLIKKWGLRNCTLTAQMPCESSSVVQSSTNGIEPIRSLITEKIAKNGVKKVLVPNYPKHKKEYILAWDLPSNLNSIKIAGAMQRWIDMGMSFNTYLNYQHYEGGEIPISVVVQDIINCHKYGLKTMYYNNTPNDNEEMDVNCAGGSCTL